MELIFPGTFQAPHLRHLALVGFSLPPGSRLLATAVSLVTLSFNEPPIHLCPSNYSTPMAFTMPQLETLVILFSFPISNRDVKRQFTHTPIMAPVVLPNLSLF